MNYLSVVEVAKKWGISERSVRNYCKQGRVQGAFLTGKTWNIPEDANKPNRIPKKIKKQVKLIDVLKREQESRISRGIYHRVQVDFTYNSNHIEGSRLTHDQTRYIFETNTIGISGESINVDNIIETINHFQCINLIIENVNYSLSEKFIKQLHGVLKTDTSDSRKDWFEVGNYKRYANEVGGKETTLPENVSKEMKVLLLKYNSKKDITFEDILDFHYKFECIHPFQNGNGRVGRLIMFKECLKHNIVPFIITEELKLYYYCGLKEWKYERGYLRDTCLMAQNQFKLLMDYFKISYVDE